MFMNDRKMEFNDLVNIVRTQFRERYNEEVLILALGGSHSLGFANHTSDIDMYLIYSQSQEKNGREVPLLSSFHDKSFMIKVDVMSVALGDILAQIEEYKQVEHIYPTYLHQSKKEAEEKRSTKDVNRDDFVRGMVFRTILTDFVWINKDRNIFFHLFHRGLESRDVVDFYYTRAKGNYEHAICGRNEVLCRKYLYTLHEILYCIWIIEHRTIPPMLFGELRFICKKDSVQGEIDKLISLNNFGHSEKEKMMVVANDELNVFIKDNLIKIENEIDSLRGVYLKNG